MLTAAGPTRVFDVVWPHAARGSAASQKTRTMARRNRAATPEPGSSTTTGWMHWVEERGVQRSSVSDFPCHPRIAGRECSPATSINVPIERRSHVASCLRISFTPLQVLRLLHLQFYQVGQHRVSQSQAPPANWCRR